MEIRDNLTARIAEARREGWPGEVEGLQVSLAGTEEKLAQIDRRTCRPATDLGIPQARTRLVSLFSVSVWIDASEFVRLD